MLKTHRDFEIGDTVYCDSNHKRGVITGFYKLDTPLLPGFRDQQTHLLIVKQSSHRVAHLIPANCSRIAP